MLRRRNNESTQIPNISYRDCPAKTYEEEQGQKRLGRCVLEHSCIVGSVAQEIIRRSVVHHLFPPGSALTAACHDIGKVSPTFYNLIHHHCRLPLLPGFSFELERNWGGHAGVSLISAKAMLAPAYVPEILGQHHGFLPKVEHYSATDKVFGGHLWQKEREKLVEQLKVFFQEDWPQIKNIATVRLLSGLTSVADWVGSGQYFDDPQEPWQEKVSKALDEAGFILPTYRLGLSFSQIFGFSPRTAQEQYFKHVKGPGVYILEAPMGLGKTEAALYAAYRLLEQGKAGGIYFALPTQLTSNKIYERFNQFLDVILAPECPHRALLLHGNAWLVNTEMGEEGRPGGSWFHQGKRGILAPFAVGTIDQALMAAMNVKHGFVRAFGLAGKVVILDEVHTYDTYTGTIIDALLDLLVELDCTVLILSATLNKERREELIGVKVHDDNYPLITAFAKTGQSIPSDTDSPRELPISVQQEQKARVLLQRDLEKAIDEALYRAEIGQQVLWIENTVGEAQQRYLDLASRSVGLGIECGLLHSRFTLEDRETIEDRWVSLYGKAGMLNGERGAQGRILVGTQVLEQSLDIDADFLVSRFAPSDMVLQRLGRLWRHQETPRPVGARQEAWLLAPELEAAQKDPYTTFGDSAYVYSPYVLCRSLEVWQQYTTVHLPTDIRKIINATYETRIEEGSMRRWLYELQEGNRYRKGQRALSQLAQITLAEVGPTQSEVKAQTRYSEVDSIDVLLLRNISHDASTNTGKLTLLDGSIVHLPLNKGQLNRYQWRQLTACLMRQMVQVSVANAPKKNNKQQLMHYGLHHCFYLGAKAWEQYEDESLLRVALVSATDELKSLDNQNAHAVYKLEYRPDIGYQVKK